jgi:predicted metal-dependent phosphotriesterase family hydrolase
MRWARGIRSTLCVKLVINRFPKGNFMKWMDYLIVNNIIKQLRDSGFSSEYVVEFKIDTPFFSKKYNFKLP